MTERLFDETGVGLACPKCQHEAERTVGWLHTHDQTVCPGCGKPFRVDSTQAIRALQACARRAGDAGCNPYEPIKIR